MKCGIKVNNRQCKKNVTSGLTIEMLDSVVYCCTQHYTQYKNTPYMDIPLYVSTQKVIDTNNNTPEEETMNSNIHHQGIYVPIGYDEYDQEHSLENALAQLEGQLYTTLHTAVSGNFIIEACSHEDCHEGHNEVINECRGEICCGESDCQHYTALLCRYHVPNNTPKEETMNTTNIPKFTENGKGRAKCTKCSTREVNVYHLFDDLRTCAGAAPAPVRTPKGKPLTKELEDSNMVGEWYANKHLANKRLVELKVGRVKPANNENGFWVWYPKNKS